MLIAFNVVLIGIAALITYWWANQGVFSALLHLVCVAVAGAVAIAFWEPLTLLLMRGSFFDDYASGTSLVLVFVLTLLVLRIAIDKLAPANVPMPHWVNLAFGGAAGAAAAVLSLGIFVIGAGHMQSRSSLMGFKGWARSPNQSARIIKRNSLWVPFHELTSDFYSLLSVTSFATPRPLRHYTPDLDRQVTLIRDSYSGGKGKVSLRPDAASVSRLYFLDGARDARYFVQVKFKHGAWDSGEQLTLSSSQVRLISTASGLDKPKVVHPVAWRQHSGYHRFDDLTHYLSSEPGKEQAEPVFEFQVPREFVPRFIQIRGTRYALPEARPAPAFLASDAADPGTPNADREVAAPSGGNDIQASISVSNSIRPGSASKNTLPGSIEEKDGFLTTGYGKFERGRSAGSRALAIKGIYEPGGTRCVRLDVSRGGPADVFRYANSVADGAELALVDSRGSSYSPVGYFYQLGKSVEIRLEPTTRMKHLDQMPTLPTSGNQILELIFYVTEGATITGFRYGDIDVGYCSFTVPEKK